MRKQTAFLAALSIQAGSWIIVLGHRLTLNPRADQLFFGLKIPFELSQVFRVIEVAVILLSFAAIFQLGIKAFAHWLF